MTEAKSRSPNAALACLAAACLLATSCAVPPTPAQRAQGYRAGIATGNAACLGLLADGEVPKTAEALRYCRMVLTQECAE
jgi:hypothetical protein